MEPGADGLAACLSPYTCARGKVLLDLKFFSLLQMQSALDNMKASFFLLLCCFLSFIFGFSKSSAKVTKELHYAVFTSGPEGAFDSSGSVPAVEIAEKQIAKSSVLQGYALTHTSIEDTYVSVYVI